MAFPLLWDIPSEIIVLLFFRLLGVAKNDIETFSALLATAKD
jgi:hypothetical protein